MTIKIEREALQCISNDVSLCSTPLGDEQQVDRIPEPRLKVCSTTSFPDLELTDDDSSVSSYSFSSSTTERRVTWSTPLVTEVNTRERTKLEDVRVLFYSHEETQRWVPNARFWHVFFPLVGSVLFTCLWHDFDEYSVIFFRLDFLDLFGKRWDCDVTFQTSLQVQYL